MIKIFFCLTIYFMLLYFNSTFRESDVVEPDYCLLTIFESFLNTYMLYLIITANLDISILNSSIKEKKIKLFNISFNVDLILFLITTPFILTMIFLLKNEGLLQSGNFYDKSNFEKFLCYLIGAVPFLLYLLYEKKILKPIKILDNLFELNAKSTISIYLCMFLIPSLKTLFIYMILILVTFILRFLINIKYKFVVITKDQNKLLKKIIYYFNNLINLKYDILILGVCLSAGYITTIYRDFFDNYYKIYSIYHVIVQNLSKDSIKGGEISFYQKYQLPILKPNQKTEFIFDTKCKTDRPLEITLLFDDNANEYINCGIYKSAISHCMQPIGESNYWDKYSIIVKIYGSNMYTVQPIDQNGCSLVVMPGFSSNVEGQYELNVMPKRLK